ncbi:hypothetical protein HPB52_021055 [Rhipicephalus sanguineus]|uniref:Uncharacterized protein n=1 Tax=Rhipicephalus sanguineus TaxID=34632 RepID=A0A9D4PKP9_RHISA|nr:hypothetical protein HPB52_021055 [Rhipicephalus sanguineus]
MQLDTILTLNGVAAQPPMHDILLDALPIELRHLAAASSSSTQPYEDLCAAVLAGYGETCQPLPARLEFQASPPTLRVVPTGPWPSPAQDLTPPTTAPSTSTDHTSINSCGRPPRRGRRRP